MRKLLINTQYTITAPVTAMIDDIPEMYSYFGPSNLPHNCANSLIGLSGESKKENNSWIILNVWDPYCYHIHDHFI